MDAYLSAQCDCRHMSIQTRTIKQKVLIPATPDEVYDALMDPKQHTDFTGAEAKGSAKVGGTFSAWDGYITAKNLELERGKKIVQEWKTTEWPDGYPPSRLEITLKPIPDGTELFLVQSKVPEEQADDYDEGWLDNYWDPMLAYFEERARGKKE